MSRTSTLLKGLHSMLARLTDGTFDDPSWALEDTYEVFRVIPEIERSKVTVYSIRSPRRSRGPKQRRDRWQLVRIGKDGISHFHGFKTLPARGKLLYCLPDLIFEDPVDRRKQPLLER